MGNHSCAAVAVTICVSLLGCGQTSRVDVAAEEQVIRELDRRWQAAVDARDIEACLAFYAPDGRQMPANAPAVVGEAAIRQWYESWLLDPNVSSSFAPEVVEVAASGDLAYDRGTYRFEMQTPEGPVVDEGKYVVVWRKTDGEWRAVLDIGNSDLPQSGS